MIFKYNEEAVKKVRTEYEREALALMDSYPTNCKEYQAKLSELRERTALKVWEAQCEGIPRWKIATNFIFAPAIIILIVVGIVAVLKGFA